MSACLLGRACRYDGGTRLDAALARTLEAEGVAVHGFCPEEAGGLGTPRPAASLRRGGGEAVLDGDAEVVTIDGTDVTAAFVAGAEAALATCRDRGIRRAFLKERSPSCGVEQTRVDGELVVARGVTAERLARAGVAVAGIEGPGGGESSTP